jgi:hypothetical protein
MPLAAVSPTASRPRSGRANDMYIRAWAGRLRSRARVRRMLGITARSCSSSTAHLAHAAGINAQRDLAMARRPMGAGSRSMPGSRRRGQTAGGDAEGWRVTGGVLPGART